MFLKMSTQHVHHCNTHHNYLNQSQKTVISCVLYQKETIENPPPSHVQTLKSIENVGTQPLIGEKSILIQKAQISLFQHQTLSARKTMCTSVPTFQVLPK